MPTITYDEKNYIPRKNESLVDMFIRSGVTIPYSCRAGVCHTCRHKATSGAVPEAAQTGLSPIYQRHGFFLLCKCIPENDILIEKQSLSEKYIRMTILEVVLHPEGKHQLHLLPHSDLTDSPSHFNLFSTPDGLPIPCQRVTSAAEDNGKFIAWLSSSDWASEIPSLVNQDVDAQFFPEATNQGIPQESGLTRAFPSAQPGLWKRLGEGKTLMAALRRFYAAVYQDALLSPFFTEVTMGRITEKQYNFLSQAITGDKVYFGERPRNAHHWMVISDELMDHREALMHESLISEGVSPSDTGKIITIENLYRQDIVKESPWPKVVFGREIAADGFESLQLDEATLCDNCHCEIQAEETVIYHTRTGKVFCHTCQR